MDSPTPDSDGQQTAPDRTRTYRSVKRPSSAVTSGHQKTRKRSTIACNVCRARRTKCDNQRPSCTYCRTHATECRYEETSETPASRVEVELAAINKRLNHLTSLLVPSSQALGPGNGNGSGSDGRTASSEFSGEDDSPFKLLGTSSMMRILGLDPNFARDLLRLERRASQGGHSSGSRLFIVQHQQAISALAAFSERIHVWFPILRPGFSEHYLRIISGPLIPSVESCLALLVAAIGCVAESDGFRGDLREGSDGPYFEAALAALPMVISDCSAVGVQCLMLFSIYYCCLLRPCQAHDYILIAAFKVQNLLKSSEREDPETSEHVKRAYWAVLLLESELSIQFDFAKSGIWGLDESIALPDSRRTWQFAPEVGSPFAASTTSPGSVLSVGSASTDKVQSYFLAEIAMRRMLHRCNTAIRRNVNGRFVYAPGIALELELQLDEWYNYLPDIIRFNTNVDAPDHDVHPVDPLTNFLRVQYYCCKISIYWPAVYQAIHDGVANGQLLDHCQRFFSSYVQLMPSILSAFYECMVNRWTLFTSIFMTSMAAMKAAITPCLSSVWSSELYQCFASASHVNRQILERSPSLMMLQNTLEERLATQYPPSR